MSWVARSFIRGVHLPLVVVVPVGGYISFPVLKPACGGTIRELLTICCFRLLGDEIGGDGKALEDGDDVFPLVV